MDRYHIYEAIGRGKHSVVYKGRRKKTIQHYAIKSVDKSQRPRVLQEVQVLRSLSHDLVLKFYAWYETQNHLWLILEYCVGGDLLGVISGKGTSWRCSGRMRRSRRNRWRRLGETSPSPSACCIRAVPYTAT